MKTPFAVDPHEKILNGTGPSASLMRSIYKQRFMSEPIENYVVPNEPSNHNLDKKHLQNRHHSFRCDREPSRIPIRTLQRLSNKSRKVREFVCLSEHTTVFKNALFFF